MIRAGTPTTVHFGSTSRMTTVPAPTTASAPTVRHWMTFAPSPKNASSPTRTRPAKAADRDALYFADGVHKTVAGHRAYADALLPVLLALDGPLAEEMRSATP